MVVTIDTYTAAAASGATATINLSGLVADDLVLAVMSKSSGGTNTVNGLGGALTAVRNWQVANGSTRLYLYQGTGVTGAQTVSVIASLSSVGNLLTVLVIHGLADPSIESLTESIWYAINGAVTGLETSTTIEGPAAVDYGNGQAAVFLALTSSSSTSTTFPYDTDPTTGWSVDRASQALGGQYVAHHIAVADGTAEAHIQSAIATSLGAVMLILGTPVVTDDGFTGWGTPI